MNRVEMLKSNYMNCKRSIDAERAELVTQAYRKFEGLPAEQLRAETFKWIVKNMTIYIGEGELIVGSQAPSLNAVPIFPEFSYDWILAELDTFSTRRADKFEISEETKARLRDVLPWWENKTTKELAKKIIPSLAWKANDEHVYILTALGSGIGHVILDYNRVLTRGLKSIREEAEKKLNALPLTDPCSIEKRNFYTSIIIACEAIVIFANRYANLAECQASEEKDPERRREFENIAAICRRVPEYPATTFHEALQSFWLAHVAIHIESSGHSNSVARFDQYMYPYYKTDIEAGRIDDERALELLCCLWVKFNELNKVRDAVGSLAFGGYPMFQNLIVGGVDDKGNDMTNELSYLCMKATDVVSLPQPSFSVRYGPLTPNDFLFKACELAKKGSGMPAFYNDGAVIPILLSQGVSLEDARNYGIMGCVEPNVPGKTEGFFLRGVY